MHFHAVFSHVKCDVRHVQKIVCKIFLDDVALIATANDKVINAVMGIGLHDVPQDWLTTYLNHGLWLGVSFLTDTSTQSTSKNYCFQNSIPF